MGLFIKGLSAWVQSRLDPYPNEQNRTTEHALHVTHPTNSVKSLKDGIQAVTMTSGEGGCFGVEAVRPEGLRQGEFWGGAARPLPTS